MSALSRKRSPHTGRPPGPPRSPTTLESRLILDLMACIKASGYTVSSVFEAAGIAKGAPSGWVSAKGNWGSPKLRSFCAVLEAIGLTMVILPNEEETKSE